MNLLCLIGHKWRLPDGECYKKCERCGKAHLSKTFHDFNGGCKCIRCGNSNPDGGHKFEFIEGRCRQKCSICGKEKDIDHIWDECRCRRCGAPRDKNHDFVIVAESPIYGKCPTLGASDQYKCNFCDEKNCNHVKMDSKFSYRCSRCGHYTSVDSKTYYQYLCSKEPVLNRGNYYR